MATLFTSALLSAILIALGMCVLLRAARSGAERAVGFHFVCLGLGALPALTVPASGLLDPTSLPVALAVGHALLSLGFASLYVFVWRCFGPGSVWRRTLALSGCAALGTAYLGQGLATGFQPLGGDAIRVTVLLRSGAFLWAFVETLRFWSLMRRRVALGIGDPVVANRFLLWSLWTGSMSGVMAIGITARFLDLRLGPSAPALERALVVVPVSLGVLVAASCLALAFFPPAWYRRRLGPGAS